MIQNDAAPIEVLRSDYPRGPFRLALFDFDGTLSLLRRNWQERMTELMLDILQQAGGAIAEAELLARIESIVVGLNGRPTLVQMEALAAEVARLGGSPDSPEAYKERYLHALGMQVAARVAAIRSREVAAAEHLVHAAELLLAALAERGLVLCLASGTDLAAVEEELVLLGLKRWFGARVFAPGAHDPDFSKGRVIAQLLAEHRLAPEQLVSFGDGVVETAEVQKAGGLAIGVASEETRGRGVNPRKREQLLAAGADWIIGDYGCREAILVKLGLASN
jgi:phosphoglycolate phosphatase-like HAD superfamily hydrolase